MANGIPRYTNADAARYLPGRTSEDIVKPIIPEEELTGPIDIDSEPEPSVEALLDAARGQLSRANEFSTYYDTERLARLPASLEALQAANVPPGFRDVLRAGQAMGRGLQTASLPLSFTPAAPIGAAGLAAGSALALPEDIRQIIAPDEDESRLGGAIETAFDVAGVGPAARALRSAAGARAARPTMRVGKGRAEIPFASRQRATDPNQALAVAREVAEETGQPVEAVLAGSRKSGREAGFTQQSTAALRRLAGSGPRATRARVGQQVGLGARASEEIDPRLFRGERTIPGDRPELEAAFGTPDEAITALGAPALWRRFLGR
jgi:hypothetical protein